MSRTPHATPAGAGIPAGTALCFTAAMAVIVFAAMAVCVTGLADETRRTLRFGFAGVERSPVEVARIALHNARVAGGILLCAAVAPRLGMRAQRLIALLLATILSCSASAVGVAIGAYGTRVISAIAIHLPVEFGAVSLAGGAYVQACKQALTGRELAVVAAATGLLLLVAASLETYASIGGTR